MSEPQRMNDTSPVGRRLREHIETETGETNPRDVRLMWVGIRTGVVFFRELGVVFEDQTGGVRALPINGDIADEIHALETGQPVNVPDIQWTSSAWKRSRS